MSTIHKEENFKTYEIKMPVYTTQVMENEHGFFDMNYSDMVQILKNQLSSFKFPLSISSRYKTIITVINDVLPIDVNIGEVPSLLLQISSYKTNMYGGYFEGPEKIDIDRNCKLGNDTNYVLFYPQIVGVGDSTYSCFFLMVVYEDPHKETGSVSKLAKDVSRLVLKQPVRNIKKSIILKELERIGVVPELNVRYFSIEDSSDNVGLKYRQYIVKSSLKSEDERNFKNMPFETAQDLLNDCEDETNIFYKKKETRIRWGKVEYKITRKMIEEAEGELKETAEKIFNASESISQEELDNKIYDQSFMLEKMTLVINNYKSVDNDD